MSSLGGNTNPGNSVDPGIPGSSGGADKWSRFPAQQNVNYDGYKIVNADIDLCNDTIDNVNVLNSTLTGTTTLASGHTFAGDMNVDTNTLFVNSSQNRVGIITSSPGGELDVNGIIISRGQLVGQNGANITGNVESDTLQTGNAIFREATEINVNINSVDHTSTSEINLTTGVPDPSAPGDYNHFNFINEGTTGNGLVIAHSATTGTQEYDAVKIPNDPNGTIELGTNVSVGGDLDIAGNVVVAPGNALITKQQFPSSPYGYIRSFTSGATDIYMGETNETNPTNDQFGYALNANIGGGNDLGLAFLAKNLGAGTDTFETIATLYSSVNTSGSFPSKGLQVLGDITGNTLSVVSGVDTPNVLNVANITGDGTTPMTIDNTSADITIGNTSAGDVNIPRAVFAIGSHGASKVQSNARSVAYIGQNPRTFGDINCLQFMAPNGTSYCYAFCGQKDAGTANSVGLASVNQSTNDVVGFAPSAISGIEKWSFTAKHQSQYTGVITKEHRGMVVEATGQVVGLHDKEDFHYGISMENPDYSNATPVVRLCSTRASKGVVGVVRDVKDEPDTIDGDLVYYVKGDGHEVGDKRVQVNAIGEGLIWVANTNGNIQIGDLVQSSSEQGYAEKQDDDVMRSCTIAKITANCDFIQDQVSVKKILKDDDGNNVLDKEGRMIWINGDTKQDKYKMRYLANGRKAVLLPCIYYCG